MKLFLRLLKYVFPFKRNIFLVVIFHLLYAVFSLVSFTMVVPFLEVLFSHEEISAAKPLFSLSVSGIKTIFTYYMGIIITNYGKFYALIFIAISMIIFSLLSNVCRYFGQFWLSPIRTGIAQKIRKELYDRVLILPLSFYAHQKKGDVMNRFGSDVQEVEWSVIASFQTFCRDPFMVIIFLITLLHISLKLTAITLLVLPISVFLIAWIGKNIKKSSANAQQLLGNISAIFEETIGGLRIIKGYNAIEHAARRFDKESFAYYRLHKKIFRINELASPMVEFLCILSIAVIMMFAGNLILVSGELSAELFMLYVVIFSRIISPAKHLVAAIYIIQKGLPSAQRIYAIIDADEEITEKENASPLIDFKDKICYNDVSFSYKNRENRPDTNVLSHINLSIKKGEKIALVGPSGGGKSTLVDLLPRFHDVCSGSITIDNIDIRNYKISDLRQIFGIVNQDVTLFNTTVFNNIAFGLNQVTEEQVIEAAKKAYAHDFITKMENGYYTQIGDRGLKLSGGERQRLSIARAILHNPQALILDEATSALDNESEQIALQALEEFIQDKTAIIIAHRLTTVKYANRIFFIDKGKIVETGTHQQLMEKRGYYWNYCTLQQ